jgi:hypothetical protein
MSFCARPDFRRKTVFCDPDDRFIFRPLRSKAARTRFAFVLVSGSCGGESDVYWLNWLLALFYPFRYNSKR